MRILRAEHLLQAGIHFYFFNELAPVGLGNALADGSAKAGIFLKQSQSGIVHQLFAIGAFLGGNLRKLRLLFGCEMEFRDLQSMEKRRLWQGA